jgi:hypothetical protein
MIVFIYFLARNFAAQDLGEDIAGIIAAHGALQNPVVEA